MSSNERDRDPNAGNVGYRPKINEVAKSCLEDLKKERSRLSEDFPLAILLIDEAIERIYATGRIPGREFHADVLKQKPMKLTQKVYVPVKQYPKFNFTGKILGPKGNSLIRLQDETQCKITIKGRNSMRDKAKEEELRKSDDPRYRHLHKDLFLEISTVATPAECYARIAYALAEIRKYLIPDKNDDISHEQLREIMELDPDMAKMHFGANPEHFRSVFDKTVAPKGAPRYIGLLKHTSRSERHEDLEDEEYEYEHDSLRERSPPPPPSKRAYEYAKVPSSVKGYKRTGGVPVYAEAKRVREVPSSKPFGSSVKVSQVYGILKNHK